MVEAVGSPASAELAGDKPLGTRLNKGIETSASVKLAEAISPLHRSRGTCEIVPDSAPISAKPVSSRKRDKDLNLEALETLVVTFGPREAARLSGINSNTVRSLAARKGWKRADKSAPNHGTLVATSQSKNGGQHSRPHTKQKTDSSTVQPMCNQAPGKALSSALSQLKGRSTIALATYSAKAAESALEHKKPLEISRKVKDVADIHKTLWPTEAESKNILQIGFIISGK